MPWKSGKASKLWASLFNFRRSALPHSTSPPFSQIWIKASPSSKMQTPASPPAYKTMSDCFNVRLTAFWIILAVSGLFSQKNEFWTYKQLSTEGQKKHRIDEATRRKSHALRACQELPPPLFPHLPLRPISFHTFHIFISHTITCTFISPRSIWLGWVKIVGM